MRSSNDKISNTDEPHTHTRTHAPAFVAFFIDFILFCILPKKKKEKKNYKFEMFIIRNFVLTVASEFVFFMFAVRTVGHTAFTNSIR